MLSWNALKKNPKQIVQIEEDKSTNQNRYNCPYFFFYFVSNKDNGNYKQQNKGYRKNILNGELRLVAYFQ